MSTNDLINVGLSGAVDDKLAELKEMGIFADKIDGYRFGVSLAIAQGAVPGELVDRLIERLADWGVTELYSQAKAGEIDFVTLMEQASAKTD